MRIRILGDVRGVSATEFAIVLPFLILLYLGGYQLSDAISAYRKVTTATRTVADLTTQYTSITNADLDAILSASQQVMSPYKISNAKLVVSQVSVDNSGSATVSWSRGLNTGPLTQGAPYTLPNSIKQNNTSLIVASIQYAYTPIVAPGLIGAIPMRDDIIMSPRASSTVKKTT